jgi:hypothetical protein
LKLLIQIQVYFRSTNGGARLFSILATWIAWSPDLTRQRPNEISEPKSISQNAGANLFDIRAIAYGGVLIQDIQAVAGSEP